LESTHNLEVRNMKTHVIEFEKEKETKNTIRFAEVTPKGQPPIMGTAYVQKWAVGDAAKVKVTLEVPE